MNTTTHPHQAPPPSPPSLPYPHESAPQRGLHPLHFFFFWWGWEAVTVSFGMASYQTIRLPSDSLSRWRWDRAPEAQTPADSESMEASPDLLPDGGALMWGRVSFASPAWLAGPDVWMQACFRALQPRLWWAAAAPLWGLDPGQDVVIYRWMQVHHSPCLYNHVGVLGCRRVLHISLRNINTATYAVLRSEKEPCE